MQKHKIHQRSSFVQQGLKILISGSLMVWLISRIEWDEALQLMKEGSVFYFVAAFIAIQLTVASSVWKWQLLIHSSLKNKDRDNISFLKLGRYYYIGLFFNNFLPGSVGGDVVRVLSLSRHVGMSHATASVAFERLTSGAALTAIVLIASLFMDSLRPFLVPIYGASAIIIVLLLLLVFFIKKSGKGDNESNILQNSPQKLTNAINKLKQVVGNIGETAGNYRREGWRWWLVIGVLSLLFQVGLAWINQLLFLGFRVEVGLLDLLVIISVISFITMVPLSLNGIGVREASYVLFFQELGIPNEIAISVSLLFFIQVTLSSLAGGLFWLSERRKPVEAIREQIY
ncbi:lysylphosphatidylglycerol synthase transmembrane domain-containing protein [Neobacillus sp. LXY-4]|uniref:lysylphosphatidylglycerol synthase transmembrane domain-containing protein n=1 Tax=Neobacillus sp. LXY-4 TaxID=3379826 RepID=UPI003EE11DD3